MNITVTEAATPTLASVRDALAAFGQAHPEIIRLTVFGSVARGDATPESDVDVVVNFDPAWKEAAGGYEYFDAAEEMRAELALRLGRSVHLIDHDAVTNALRIKNYSLPRAVARDGRLVYEAHVAAA